MKTVRARIGAVATLATLAVLAVPSLAWADCIKNATGAGVMGGLCCNTEVVFPTQYINDSDWTGNLAYNANRYYSDGSPSYHLYVSSGPANYGTSGDVFRATGDQRGGYSTMSSWSMIQYSQSHC
jgi:hypothetical protein